jgi:hypothetical protein
MRANGSLELASVTGWNGACVLDSWVPTEGLEFAVAV